VIREGPDVSSVPRDHNGREGPGGSRGTEPPRTRRNRPGAKGLGRAR
jgi:hypothetical protein